jgi:hypothetical protein
MSGVSFSWASPGGDPGGSRVVYGSLAASLGVRTGDGCGGLSDGVSDHL